MRRKTKYGLLLILFSVFCFSCEQEISDKQEDSFIKFYGSSLMDRAGDVEVLGNGGYAICGTETSSAQGKRMVLIITDEFGNIVSGFPKYYVEEGLETGGNSMIALEDGSGGFILSGYVERPVEGSQQVQKDIFIVRTSSSGEVSWQRTYGSNDDEQVLHSVEMIRSGYLLAGYRMKDGNSDLMMMGVTESGDSIRLGLNYNNPYATNTRANYLLNAGDMYLCVCTFDKANGEGTGIQVLTFDDELSPLARNLTREYNEFGMCVLDEGGGDFLVLGNRENGSGHMELVLYGIETNGLLITNSSLNATISAPGTDFIGERMIETASGDLAIAGTRRIQENNEILLQFVSSSYQPGEGVSFGASGDQTGKDIELADDGGFVVLGDNAYEGSGTISLLKTNANGKISSR
jgi:hypothetical protein